MEPLNGQSVFPVQTPYWITQKGFTSQRLNKILHVWTKRTNKQLSQDYGYYPRDIHAKKKIDPLFAELVHFHRNTVDAQGMCKLLRADVGKKLIEALSLAETHYTKKDNNYFFTHQQARELLDRLPSIQLGDTQYTARLVTQADIMECLTLFGDNPMDMHFADTVFSPYRKSLAHLWNFCPKQSYILGEEKVLKIVCTKKESLGAIGSSLPGATGLIKLALEKIEPTLPDAIPPQE